jgi:hypothetical protein
MHSERVFPAGSASSTKSLMSSRATAPELFTLDSGHIGVIR